MKFFLTLKHWQMFMLTFGLAFIFQVLCFRMAVNQSIVFNEVYHPIMAAFFLLLLLPITFLFGWYLTMGVLLHKRLPEKKQIPLTVFIICITIRYVYLCFLMIMINKFIMDNLTSFTLYYNIIVYIIPLYIISMFCFLYAMYFIAKSLAVIESQKGPFLPDYFGDIFLLWIFPVGIWFVQPRINAAYNEEISNLTESESDKE